MAGADVETYVNSVTLKFDLHLYTIGYLSFTKLNALLTFTKCKACLPAFLMLWHI